MSAPTPDPAALPDEPFGQRGVRQYAGRMLAWVFLAGALAAFAMSHRSTNFGDRLDWRGQGQMLRLTSGHGQLMFDGAFDEKIKGEGGWQYRSGFDRRLASRFDWVSDLGRLLGAEGAWQVRISRDADSGFFVRVRWWLLGVVLMVQPLVFAVHRLLKWRRGRYEPAGGFDVLTARDGGPAAAYRGR